jgi:hypothetical protein
MTHNIKKNESDSSISDISEQIHNVVDDIEHVVDDAMSIIIDAENLYSDVNSCGHACSKWCFQCWFRSICCYVPP